MQQVPALAAAPLAAVPTTRRAARTRRRQQPRRRRRQAGRRSGSGCGAPTTVHGGCASSPGRSTQRARTRPPSPGSAAAGRVDPVPKAVQAGTAVRPRQGRVPAGGSERDRDAGLRPGSRGSSELASRAPDRSRPAPPAPSAAWTACSSHQAVPRRRPRAWSLMGSPTGVRSVRGSGWRTRLDSAPGSRRGWGSVSAWASAIHTGSVPARGWATASRTESRWALPPRSLLPWSLHRRRPASVRRVRRQARRSSRRARP